MRWWFSVLEKLETHAAKAPKASSFVKNLLFPLNHWVRQKLVELAEMDFQYIDEELRDTFRQYGTSFMSTLVSELQFNNLRDKERRHTAGSLSALAAWHRCACSCLLGDVGRCPVQFSQVSDSVSAKKVPRSTFRGGVFADGGLEEHLLDSLHEKRPSWPSPGPLWYRYTAMAWQSAVEAEGEWDTSTHHWLALICTLGSLLYKRGSGVAR